MLLTHEAPPGLWDRLADLVRERELLFERLRVVVDSSGAAAVAAALAHPADFADRRVGIIVSGGNINADSFATLIAASKDDQP